MRSSGIDDDPGVHVQEGQASWTARSVAAQRHDFERVPAAHGRPDDDQRLHADVADGVDTGGSPMGRYLQARTLFVDREAVDALDAGVDQVVIVGAGYDGRAWRYARPGVTWFELDHPATQADKRHRVARLGLADDHVQFAAAEIGRDDVGAALADAGHDAARPTVVLCEGLVSYLPPDAPAGLFTALSDRAASGSRLAAEIPLVARTDSDRARKAALDRRVRALGEPLRTRFDADRLDGLLRDWGWRPQRLVDPIGRPLDDTTSGAAFVRATTGETG